MANIRTRREHVIRYITSAPYHPVTDGLVERCIESFKNGMNSEKEVKKVLLAYRDSQSHESRHPSCFSISQRVIERNFI